MAHLNEALNRCGFEDEITEVVSGHATGVDQMGERYAENNRLPLKKFLPDWERYGKAAGCMRNIEMAKYAEACICIWGGESTGTNHMIRMAKQFGLKLCVVDLGNPFEQSELGL